MRMILSFWLSCLNLHSAEIKANAILSGVALAGIEINTKNTFEKGFYYSCCY